MWLKKNNKKGIVRENIETFVGAIFLAVFLRATVAEARYIPSESMLPTLEVKDKLVVEKISNYTGLPNRGDILVFYPPFETKNNSSLLDKTLMKLSLSSKDAYIKRVIGLPNETIEVRDGNVLINNKVLDESSYIKEKPFYNFGPLKLKEDELFMMGDNRNNSADSHVWGALPLKNVIGHAVLKYWPIDRIGSLK